MFCQQHGTAVYQSQLLQLCVYVCLCVFLCEREREREVKEVEKEETVCFQGVSGTLQATGYKRVSIILSKLQECTAQNEHAQITHCSVWYINSHFLTQTKKAKARKKKRASH